MMLSIFQSFENALDAFGRSRVMSFKAFQYMCGPISGFLTATVFVMSMVAAHQIPPVKASSTPEELVQFFTKHETGSKVGVALILLSGGFYLPFSVSISAQMRKIPNLPYLVSAIQLASGAAGICTWIMPAEVLALITYRLDRDPLQTQTLVDYFFFTLLMPWPTFVVQNWAFAYAVLVDRSPKPIFPKLVGLVSVVAPLLYISALGMHTTKSGVWSWQGLFGFYAFGFGWVTQVFIDSFFLYRAISRDDSDGANNSKEDRSYSQDSDKLAESV